MSQQATGKPVWWQDLSWPELREYAKNTDIALLPIGSTEQHGPHMPTGVDGYIPIGIAEKVSARTGLAILPTHWYAPCSWHDHFPGTIHVSPESMINLLVDICCSVERSTGIKHIIGINGHTGGCDSTLLVAADTVIAKSQGARLWIASVVDIAIDEVLETCTSPVLGHADEVETAKMMAIRPDLVHVGKVKANNKQPKSKFMSINYRGGGPKMLFRLNKDDWKNVAPAGYIGDPAAATPEKGERMLEAAAGNIVKFTMELKKWPDLMKG